MKRLLLAGCLSLLALAGCRTDDASHGTMEPAVAGAPAAALVNGVPIPMAALESVVAAERARIEEHGASPAQDDPTLRREALDLLVAGELLHQAAKAAGIVVSAQDVDARLATARSQFASDDAFSLHLASAGLTPERLRARVERELAIEAYTGGLAGVSDGQDLRARELYESQRERFEEPAEVHAQQIIVLVRPQDPPERRAAARKKIEEAYRRAAAGEDFEALAREYSESPFAERGGDLGFFPRGRALPELEEVVFATPPGKITPVFETPHGYNVVRVLERRGGRVRPFEDVRGALRLVLARQQASEALRRHVRELREKAEVRVLDPSLGPT